MKIELPKIKGGFKLIYSDPAWENETWSDKGLEGRPQHYKRMTLEEIKAMPVADVAAKDCWLFMWTTTPHLEQAFEVLKAWGFKYSGTGFVWIKMNKKARMVVTKTKRWFAIEDIFMGMGYTTRKNAEICLVARCGSPKRLNADVREVIISALREHSRKPDECYDRLERFADGPFLELFSRCNRDGWTAWGDELNKFGDPGIDE